jgi:hypothetical protein
VKIGGYSHIEHPEGWMAGICNGSDYVKTHLVLLESKRKGIWIPEVVDVKT